MSNKTFLIFLRVVIIVLPFLLSSCKDDEKDSEKIDDMTLLCTKSWYENLSDSKYYLREFFFFSDGVGEVMYLYKESNSDQNNGISDYYKMFTFTLENNYLILNYGFGYIERFYVNHISSNFLDLSSIILKKGGGGFQRWQVDDFYSVISNSKCRIEDFEKNQKYIISFHPDGTYESDSYPNIGSSRYITEKGTFEVENSRIRFKSNSQEALLNERIFMFCGRPSVSGSNLETENGSIIKAYLID